ncbi:class I SAM-dependent methyltransferase [Mycolicibacterium mucogenicum]|uniref:class I SAM-dependent methyltransferase n=1 Tax=Mycolicibacterium mucogenicum TaxID=56689 RepID=UPI00226A4C5C|nr:class I SAM-dependent methyltransferase [Mycolicibacterium mucogenicum]MCX8563978.1 class I SAM-dependent methyltransferase [Mycolicibacterium mucogenicum]
MSGGGVKHRYDETGLTYASTRQPDPRIGAAINAALAGMASVANIGAGTGSYEPAQTVIAVEPSRVMINQRRTDAASAVQAVAEHLPLRSASVDASVAVLTVHHWRDLKRGITELIRVARRRVAILTWDHDTFKEFWLLRDYLPAAAATDAQLAVPISTLMSLLGEATAIPIPVPHDCTDGFGGAYWRRPHAYLDETVRAGMSLCALTPKHQLEEGLSRLATELNTGEWHLKYAHLLNLPELDLGYRLLVAELP